MKEIWKPIPGYDGRYSISNTGVLISHARRSKSGKNLKEFTVIQISKEGYKTAHLTELSGIQKQHRIHRLVALCFIGRSNLCVDHIDGNRENNNYTNLRYVDQRQNMNFSFTRIGKKKSKYMGVHWNKNTGKWRSKIYIKGKNIHLGLFNTEIEAYMAYKNKLMEVHPCQR